MLFLLQAACSSICAAGCSACAAAGKAPLQTESRSVAEQRCVERIANTGRPMCSLLCMGGRELIWGLWFGCSKRAGRVLISMQPSQLGAWGWYSATGSVLERVWCARWPL
jgi:hypothetical protein